MNKSALTLFILNLCIPIYSKSSNDYNQLFQQKVEVAFQKCVKDRINWYIEENPNIVDIEITNGYKKTTPINFDVMWFQKGITECQERRNDALAILKAKFPKKHITMTLKPTNIKHLITRFNEIYCDLTTY